MTEGEVARAGGASAGAVLAPPRPRDGAVGPPPPPAGRPPRAPGGGEQPPPKARNSHWWSLRGVGPLGWAVRVVLVLVVAFIVWGVAG